jgi:hypothetical protein
VLLCDIEDGVADTANFGDSALFFCGQKFEIRTWFPIFVTDAFLTSPFVDLETRDFEVPAFNDISL